MVELKAGESSSSSDDDHNAALRSVAIDSRSVIEFATPTIASSARIPRISSKSSRKSKRLNHDVNDVDDDSKASAATLKLYQIRVQDLLHEHLDRCLSTSPVRTADESNGGLERSHSVPGDEPYDGEIRLFSNASAGIALKRKSVPKGSRRRVRILPALCDSSDELSTEQDSRFQAAVIEGATVKMQAEEAQAKAQAKFLAAELLYQEGVKAEEERVALMKRTRGEEWLPSVAKEMMKEIRAGTERRKGMSSKGRIGVVANYKI